jgi:hypothetical protein
MGDHRVWSEQVQILEACCTSKAEGRPRNYLLEQVADRPAGRESVLPSGLTLILVLSRRSTNRLSAASSRSAKPLAVVDV